MKILFANNIRGYYGGVEQVVSDYGCGLAERGHTVYLAYGADGRDPGDFAKPFEDTFPCSSFGGAPPGSDDGEPQPFDLILDRVKPDVVFFHKLRRLPQGIEHNTDVRTVRMAHDHDLWCPIGLGYNRYNRRVCRHPAGWRCYLNLAFIERSSGSKLPVRVTGVGKKIREMERNHLFDAILANSTYMRSQLLAGGFPPEKTHVCYPVLKETTEKSKPIPSEPIVMYAGSLVRGKGVDLLLRAFSLLEIPAQLNIVGVGGLESQLKRLSHALGVEKRVNFVGWVAHGEMARQYQRAKVVAVPSCWPEPFGLVGVEAMRHSRPVVAFGVGGIPDWLEHEETGLIVPEQDIHRFAKSLEKLLLDTEYAGRLGENGANRVRERFSFERCLDAVEGHLRGVPPVENPEP